MSFEELCPGVPYNSVQDAVMYWVCMSHKNTTIWAMHINILSIGGRTSIGIQQPSPAANRELIVKDVRINDYTVWNEIATDD
jgi:hypothetical protein